MLSVDGQTGAGDLSNVYQPLSANLTSWSGEDPDNYYASSEITSATSSAISALSLVYQPLDSDLTAIAALSTTEFGRTLLTQANAAAGRSALELGSLATANTITTAIGPVQISPFPTVEPRLVRQPVRVQTSPRSNTGASRRKWKVSRAS